MSWSAQTFDVGSASFAPIFPKLPCSGLLCAVASCAGASPAADAVPVNATTREIERARLEASHTILAEGDQREREAPQAVLAGID